MQVTISVDSVNRPQTNMKLSAAIAVFLINVWTYELLIGSAEAVLQRVPDNANLLVGSQLRLNCSTNYPGVAWVYVQPGSSSTTLYPVRTQNTSRYQVDTNSLHDLIANVTDVAYCGTYTCIDNNDESDQQASASVQVATNPECTVNDTESLSYDSITVTCSMSYCNMSVDLSKHIFVNGTNVSPDYNQQSYFDGSLPLIKHTTILTGTALSLNGSNIVYNSPFTGSSTIPPIIIRYPAGNLRINPVWDTYSNGDIITCSADGDPTPVIYWTNDLNKTVSHSSMMFVNGTVGSNYTFLCVATNTIKGTNYTASVRISFTVVTAPPTTTRTTPTTIPTTTPPRHPCLSAPCQHGGTCENQENGYVCRCPPRNTGVNCERDIGVFPWVQAAIAISTFGFFCTCCFLIIVTYELVKDKDQLIKEKDPKSCRKSAQLISVIGICVLSAMLFIGFAVDLGSFKDTGLPSIINGWLIGNLVIHVVITALAVAILVIIIITICKGGTNAPASGSRGVSDTPAGAASAAQPGGAGKTGNNQTTPDGTVGSGTTTPVYAQIKSKGNVGTNTTPVSGQTQGDVSKWTLIIVLILACLSWCCYAVTVAWSVVAGEKIISESDSNKPDVWTWEVFLIVLGCSIVVAVTFLTLWFVVVRKKCNKVR